MPVEASAKVIADLIPTAKLQIYAMAAHGLYCTHAERVQRDILEFVTNVSNAQLLEEPRLLT